MTTQPMVEQSPLAIDGGEKAFIGMQGVAEPKIGVEEYFAIGRRLVSPKGQCSGCGRRSATPTCPRVGRPCRGI